MKGRHALSFVLVALIAMGVGFSVKAAHFFKGAELASVDKRFDERGKQKPRSDVVIVAMDAKTWAQDGAKPVLDRTHDAAVIRQLTKAGAGVIAYDVPFTTLSPDSKADVALFTAVKAAPKAVLGISYVLIDGSTDIFGDPTTAQQAGLIPSWTGIPEDTDGGLRRTELSNTGLDSFAVAAVRAQHGGKAPRAGKSVYIDYPGPPGTIPRLSFADVENGNFSPAAVKGKIVVVGPTDPRFGNIHKTSTGARMSGAEIQAAAIGTVLDGLPLRDGQWWIDALAILVLAALNPLLAMWLRWWIATLIQLVALALFVVLAQVAFNDGAIIDIVPPLAAGLTSLVATPLMVPPVRRRVGDLVEKLGPPSANRRTRRVLATSLVGAALFVTTTALVLQAANAFVHQELQTVSARFSVRGPQGPPKDVVLVAIDEKTFTTPPRRTFPFKRTQHAKVIDNLIRAGAKVIAYDIQFTEPSGDDQADLALFDAVRRAKGKVILGSVEVRPDGTTNIFDNGDALKESTGIPAWSGYIPTSDGGDRQIQGSSNNLRSFDVEAADRFTGRTLPVPSKPAWIDFRGPPETVKTLSFVDVRRNKFNPADVRGKIVVVGATANNLQDIHPSSYGDAMPGPEIHVNGINTVLEGFPLKDAPNWLNILLIIALGFLAPVAGLRLRVVPALLIGAVGLVLLLIGTQLLFQHAGWVNHVTYPFAAGLAGMLLTGGIHALTTAFEREQTRDAFARFVPESVVDQVLNAADGVRLGGVRGEATVMFSDLRGFTSFSETLEPERVIDSLNRYLTLMSEAILDHGGTLVAYMGDGIMAVFGAPLTQPDHADRALEAARDMLARMEDFNDFLRGENLHDGFKMGIGLNSGAVMSGNVGSERRLEYTALGDTTNTAARLEGMTKGTPHQLYISDTTKQLLQRAGDDLVQVGEAEVRGRKAKVLLWSLRDTTPAPAPAPAPPDPVEA